MGNCAHLSGEVLAGLGECLGGKESRRSHSAGQQRVRPLKLIAHAEVCDLYVTVLAHQQVGGFDVAMDDLLVMH